MTLADFLTQQPYWTTIWLLIIAATIVNVTRRS